MKRLILLFMVLVLAIPVMLFAASDSDKTYCEELSALYRRYIEDARGRRFDVEANVAMEDCKKGNTAAAIPVLERKLRQSGFSLPKEFTP
ncbi:MAG: hypothetical protein J0H97_20330 [Alphaproteobacteria bacterium]|jgi:hypothetical protein|nr:hypothetical protein [Alphaproteobacteria bacterium]